MLILVELHRPRNQIYNRTAGMLKKFPLPGQRNRKKLRLCNLHIKLPDNCQVKVSLHRKWCKNVKKLREI